MPTKRKTGAAARSAKPTPAAKKATETAGKTIDETLRDSFDNFIKYATVGEKFFRLLRS